jgi:hypothetical protein
LHDNCGGLVEARTFTVPHGCLHRYQQRANSKENGSQSKPFLNKDVWVVGIPNRSLLYVFFPDQRPYHLPYSKRNILRNFLVFLPRVMGVPMADNTGHRANADDFLQR